MKRFRFLATMLLLVSMQPGWAQNDGQLPVRLYQMGDWRSYKNCNYPTSLTNAYEYIYFGTSGGIVPYQRYGRYWEMPYTVSDGLADDFITAVLYDESTQFLWAAHRKGLSFLTPSAETWTNIPTGSYLPWDVQIDRLGVSAAAIWATAPGGFLLKINKILGNLQSYEHELPTDVIWSPSMSDPLPRLDDYFITPRYRLENRGVIIDEEFREFPLSFFISDVREDVFGGAWGLGLLEGDRNSRSLNLEPMGPLQNFIFALASGSNSLWMGGYLLDDDPLFNRAGLSRLILEEGTWQYYENLFIPELATYEIYDLAFKDQRLWIGTNQGVSVYHYKKNSWKRIPMTKGLSDEVINTIALEDSLAWIGTPHGLNTIKIPSLKVKRFPLTPKGPPLNILKVVANQKRIWVGTDNGLYSVERGNHKVSHFDINGREIGLNESVAADFDAIAATDSLIVFAHYRSILQYFQKTDVWENLPYIPEINDRDIYDMDLMDGYLWIGTDAGAFLVRLADNYFEHYTTADGLAGNHVFRIIMEGDYVWFATDKGLTQYNWGKYAL